VGVQGVRVHGVCMHGVGVYEASVQTWPGMARAATVLRH
jgi:hypothetical protein